MGAEKLGEAPEMVPVFGECDAGIVSNDVLAEFIQSQLKRLPCEALVQDKIPEVAFPESHSSEATAATDADDVFTYKTILRKKRSIKSPGKRRSVSFSATALVVGVASGRERVAQIQLMKIWPLFEAGRHEELKEVLTLQRINDLSTRANANERKISFEDICSYLKQKAPDDDHLTINAIADEACFDADSQVMSSITVMGHSQIESSVDFIGRLERKIENGLRSEQELIALKKKRAEARVAYDELRQNVRITWVPTQFRRETDPQLMFLKTFLANGQNDDAMALIKAQRSLRVANKIYISLVQGRCPRIFIDAAKRRLDFIESQQKERERRHAEEESTESGQAADQTPVERGIRRFSEK